MSISPIVIMYPTGGLVQSSFSLTPRGRPSLDRQLSLIGRLGAVSDGFRSGDTVREPCLGDGYSGLEAGCRHPSAGLAAHEPGRSGTMRVRGPARALSSVWGLITVHPVG